MVLRRLIFKIPGKQHLPFALDRIPDPALHTPLVGR
jgi:hypothetical protein